MLGTNIDTNTRAYTNVYGPSNVEHVTLSLLGARGRHRATL